MTAVPAAARPAPRFPPCFPDDEPAIRLQQVSKTYSTHRGQRVAALAEVDLGVPTGQFVTVLGPSGCGKSTLLHLIGGLQRPDAGRVLAHGVEVTGAGPDRAMMFQSPALYPWRTALGNVAFPLEVTPPPAVRGGPGRRGRQARTRARAAELLERVGLADAAGAYPAELSGGMQQRVALARALALDPPVLLMDEPFSAVDALTREALQIAVHTACRAAGTTVVFVTHDIAEAVLLGDRVVVLSPRPGRIVADLPVALSTTRTPAARTHPEFIAVCARARAVLDGQGAAADGPP